MGREVRRVPANWEHPYDGVGAFSERRYRPLRDGADLVKVTAEWDQEVAAWDIGFVRDYSQPGFVFCAKQDRHVGTYEDYAGKRPDPADYMPAWPEQFCTLLVMYENTSEGTPISPVFATPQELARWLADNNASAFGGIGATYKQWLSTAQRGWAPSAVIDKNGLTSGVAGLADAEVAP